jgi:large subunit ribosomal protein L15
MPLKRRQPKLPGFTKASRARRGEVEHAIVNVARLEDAFEAGDEEIADALREKGLVRKKAQAVKVLGHGELTKALTVRVDQVSSTAHEKITAAGGTVE